MTRLPSIWQWPVVISEPPHCAYCGQAIMGADTLTPTFFHNSVANHVEVCPQQTIPIVDIDTYFAENPFDNLP